MTPAAFLLPLQASLAIESHIPLNLDAAELHGAMNFMGQVYIVALGRTCPSSEFIGIAMVSP